MKRKEMLMLFEDVRDQYVAEAIENRRAAGLSRRLALAALAAAMLMLMGCAVAYAGSQGWFEGFFAQRSDEPLTPEQVRQIEEKGQAVGEAVTQSGWTVELDSVLTDGRIGYVLFRVTAPEEVVLDGEWIAPDHYILQSCMGEEHAWNLESYGVSWLDDGDGMRNTGTLVMEIFPRQGEGDPFGPQVSWHIRLEDFVLRRENEEYRQELMNGKHKDQEDVVFTEEEMEKLMSEDTLVEGVWEFDVSFDVDLEDSDWVELLDEPIMIQADKFYLQGVGVPEELIRDDSVKLCSLRLSTLSLVLFFDEGGEAMIHADFGRLRVVMKDGSAMDMGAKVCRPGYAVLQAPAPIVIGNVDHILLEDGTVIPMPE